MHEPVSDLTDMPSTFPASPFSSPTDPRQDRLSSWGGAALATCDRTRDAVGRNLGAMTLWSGSL